MIYNKEIGCVYDTIIYGMLEFSKENYVKHFTEKFGIIYPLAFYDEFKNSTNISTPKELTPFFFNDGEQMCFMTSYYFYKFDKFNKTFSDFSTQLKSDENILRDIFIYYLGDKYTQNTIPMDNPAKLFEDIVNLDLESNITKQLLYTYNNFDIVINILLEYLYDVYTQLCKFHKEMHIKHKKEIKSLSNESMLKALEIYCNVNKTINISEQIVSVSFMLKYVLFYQLEKETMQYLFIFGLEAETLITKVIDYKFISAEIVFNSLSNGVKRDILINLKDGQYSATQLAERLYSVRQSINRHLLQLKEFKIIQVSQIIGKEVFYTINKDFLNISKTAICEYIDSLINPQ